MKKHICHSLIAFFGGLFEVSVLFSIFYLLFDVAGLEKPFPPTLLGTFLHILIINSFIEEGAKFLLIKRNVGQFPYGFILGFGFGIGEAVLKYPFWEVEAASINRSGAIILHIITAGIICYFVKKNKPVLGLAIAILVHTGFNLASYWVNQ